MDWWVAGWQVEVGGWLSSRQAGLGAMASEAGSQGQTHGV